MVKRISETQKSVKALREKLTGMVEQLDATGAPDRESTVNSLMDALVGLGDVEDDLLVARENEKFMRKRF